eukprot:TRINITY_DN88472_c0_g1_i1.p1 TRINITY_DN88472_c0_g1~~TRINITY_DN88472_c0_g1_i1.p1  ORF type:complete len:451 (+),score=53.16 TRINITY_DN88472_c0_g1_i1:59-1354(+)
MFIAIVAGAATGGFLFLLQMLLPPTPKGKTGAPWQSKEAQSAATLVVTGIVSAGVTVREHFKKRCQNQKVLAPRKSLAREAPTQVSSCDPPPLGNSDFVMRPPVQRRPRARVFPGMLGAILVVATWQWRRLRKLLTKRQVQEVRLVLQPSAAMQSAEKSGGEVQRLEQDACLEFESTIEAEPPPVTMPRNVTNFEARTLSPAFTPGPTEAALELPETQRAPRPTEGAIESPDARHAKRPIKSGRKKEKGIVESPDAKHALRPTAARPTTDAVEFPDAKSVQRPTAGAVESLDAKCAPRPATGSIDSTTGAAESPDAKCAPRLTAGTVESPDAKCAPRPTSHAVKSRDAKNMPAKASPAKVVTMTARENLQPVGTKRLCEFKVLHEPSSDDEDGAKDAGPAIKNLISKFNTRKTENNRSSHTATRAMSPPQR